MNTLVSDVPVIAVAALADNGVIGDDNRLIWRLKTDFRRVRAAIRHDL